MLPSGKLCLFLSLPDQVPRLPRPWGMFLEFFNYKLRTLFYSLDPWVESSPLCLFLLFCKQTLNSNKGRVFCYHDGPGHKLYRGVVRHRGVGEGLNIYHCCN